MWVEQSAIVFLDQPADLTSGHCVTDLASLRPCLDLPAGLTWISCETVRNTFQIYFIIQVFSSPVASTVFFLSFSISPMNIWWHPSKSHLGILHFLKLWTVLVTSKECQLNWPSWIHVTMTPLPVLWLQLSESYTICQCNRRQTCSKSDTPRAL